jgi:3'(2'), 5'-bisphosphate nucleotidase
LNTPPSSLLPAVIGLARRAGLAILAIYDQQESIVTVKQDGSPLSQADLVSHQTILDGLTQLTPAWPVLSEESGEIPYEERRWWEHYWLVDPLDGTKDFLARTGEFTVNIALIVAGEPVLGVVYAPALDLMYFAARQAGAFKTHRGLTQPIWVRAPQSSATVRVVSSRFHQGDLEDVVKGLGSYELVPTGSSLKFCLVAEGSADLYPRMGPTMEWDTAAAHCVLEEAGGVVAGLDGRLRYNKTSLVNPSFVAAHENMVRKFLA